MIELFAHTGEDVKVLRPHRVVRRSAVSRLPDPQELTPKRLPDLEPRHRRRVVLQAALRVAATWVLLVAGYYYIPPLEKHSGAGEIITLGIGVLVVTLIVLDQARRVVHVELPGLRAAEALAVVVPIFLLLFSTLYVSLSNTSAAMFSQELDHSSALYFTITVFSTVGFGDIVPATDAARLIVSAQMIIDLVIIGVVVRLLVNAAKMGLDRAHEVLKTEEISSRRAGPPGGEQSHPGRVTTKFSEPVRLVTGTTLIGRLDQTASDPQDVRDHLRRRGPTGHCRGLRRLRHHSGRWQHGLPRRTSRPGGPSWCS